MLISFEGFLLLKEKLWNIWDSPRAFSILCYKLPYVYSHLVTMARGFYAG